jgi:hypothetical protein
MICCTGTADFTSGFASASAKTPHLLLTLCRVMPSWGMAAGCSVAMRSLRAAFSTKIPVPPRPADRGSACYLPSPAGVRD